MLDLESLLRFCNPQQRAVLAALIATKGDRPAVAKVLGVTRRRIRRVLEDVRVKAAKAGYAPEAGWSQPLPEGHRVKGMSTLRDEVGQVEHQWQKTEREPEEPKFVPVPAGHHVEATSTMFDRQGGVVAQWVRANQAKADREAMFFEAARAAVAEFEPLPSVACAAPSFDDTITLYNLGDPHIGMLSWKPETGVDFDLKIAQRELRHAIKYLVDRSPPSREARLVNLGDFFHAQDDKQQTPKSGHKLDGDGRAAKVARIGIDLMITLVSALLTKHEHVIVRNIPGNHDPSVSFWLNEVLRREFLHNPRCDVSENANPYQYERFGKCLFGWTHGDLARDHELMPIMSVDCGPGGLDEHADAWGRTWYRHWFTGHIHHDTLKEFPGGIVEHCRTLAAKDAYGNTRWRSGRSLQSVTFDAEFGQVGRQIIEIRRVHALERQGNLFETK